MLEFVVNHTAGRGDTRFCPDPLFVSRETNCFLRQLIVSPPASVYVGPMLKTTTTFCAPVGAFAGIVNVAITVPCVESEMLVPTIVPASVTLVIGALAGGHGGAAGSVIVAVTVVPRDALPPGTETVAPPPLGAPS